MKRLRLALIGAGGRGGTYMELAARMPERYELVAAADTNEARLKLIRRMAAAPLFRTFPSADAILAEPRLADVMIIATQDDYHLEPAQKAMEMGYDLLLEKPIAQRLDEVLALEQTALRLSRRVLVCHVLRYTPFYSKLKQVVDSGILGDIVTLNATEGVGAWHQAHSFVRGHWSVTERATPMIVAKCCHDTDVVSWIMGRECLKVSSHGALTHFTRAWCPPGAPPRCIEGCPISSQCPYNALHYLGQHRRWLQYVFDAETSKLERGGATQDEIMEWLRSSPWGRCVYQCDNTAVDHQVLGMEFEGQATATLTMTAFGEGRSIEIYGTRAYLHGGDPVKRNTGADLIVREHATGDEQRYVVAPLAGGYAGHGGGDAGLMLSLNDELTKTDAREMRSSIHQSVQSHLIGFAAEAARLTGRVVDLAVFAAANRK